jgi:hypothetical protein
MLHQLHHHPHQAFRMQKRHTAATCTPTGVAFASGAGDNFHSSRAHAFQRFFEIGYFETNMVHTFAALGDEFGNGRVWRGGHEQFDAGFANFKHDDFHFLRGNFFEMVGTVAAERSVAGNGVIQIIDGDADVVDFFEHETERLLQKVLVSLKELDSKENTKVENEKQGRDWDEFYPKRIDGVRGLRPTTKIYPLAKLFVIPAVSVDCAL